VKEKLSHIFDTIRDQAGSLFTKTPNRTEVRLAFKTFTLNQKLIFGFLILALIGSLAGLIWSVNQNFLVTVKKPGGSLTEGLVGSPRFINPLLAISDADRDLVALIYSGLLRLSNDGSSFIPDLAESYSISPDNLVYTFKLKEGLTWQDGKPITTDDVIYTIQTAQDREIRSVKRANWEGVTVKKVDDRTLEFVLKKPYAAFLSNATLGIMPKHLWSNLNAPAFSLSDLNTRPIGSGPYKIKAIAKDSKDIPVSYELVPFEKFALGQANISSLTLKFYDNQSDLEKAYTEGKINSLAASSPRLEQGFYSSTQIIKVPLPRLFGVFFNQNKAQIFTHKEVREALSLATDRENLVKEVLGGAAEPLYNIFPPGTLGYEATTSNQALNIEKAKALLEENGWILNQDGIREKKETKTQTAKNSKGKTVTEKVETGNAQKLSFAISTVNLPELKRVAEKLKSDWGKIGVNVDIQVYEAGDLNQNVIRPRRYEALLFGEIVGRDSDPFPFWHSSQRLDPGLNIALYTNTKADKLMEEARALTSAGDRKDKYLLLKKEIENDTPAVFLYSPYFIYYLPASIQGVKDISSLTVPSDRFLHVYVWYEKTEKVWKIFAREKDSIKN